MPYFLIGLALLVLLLFGARAFTRANPRDLARIVRKALGFGLVALALFFAVTGRFVLAVPLAFFAATLLGRGFSMPGGFGPFAGGGSKSAGQQSRVRAEYLEMSLDHDTGVMDGRVLRGRFAGRGLTELDQDDLLELLAECVAEDQQSAQLVAAYLDREYPGWRESAGSSGDQADRAAPGGRMTTEEAYDVLGLEPGASRDTIRRAHRMLMKKLHPDQGGSTYLAAKINEAKDLLLGTKG